MSLPITLTQEQMDIVNDVVILDPDPPWRDKVLSIPGRHIVRVDTVEESTPYLEGLL